MQAPNTLYKSEVRGSISRVKTPCEQGLPHYVLQAEQRLPHATEDKAKRSFPMERGSVAKHHPAWNPQCTHTRGGCCRTDGPRRVLSCQMRHTIAAINAAWTLPAAVSSSHMQLAASAESLTAHGRRAQQPTVRLHIFDVTPVRHAQVTLSILRAFVACAAGVQTAVLVCPVWGHYRPLQRRSASDKCSVHCRPIKQRQNLP